MSRIMKVFFSALIVLTLLVTSVCGVFASNDKGNSHNYKKQFEDVSKDFWGYEAIQQLSDMGIINGFPDNTFKPNQKVTRFQFATLLIRALNLTTDSNTQTFADVPPSNSYYKYVEAASKYLTGWLRDGVLYFNGDEDAVREDMAVALVKALNVTLTSDNGQLQQLFSDYNQISPSLADYVYTAYKEGLMVGANQKFNPQGSLTRAEAATLLFNALLKLNKIPADNGQKVTTDVTYTTDATLSSLTYNGKTVPGFSPYKYAYNITLPAGTTANPVVAATVHASGATAAITQSASLPGSAKVIVVSKDGKNSRTYTVNFTVAVPQKSKDATLSSIAVNGTLLAGFSSGKTSYNVTLQAGTTTLPVVTAAVHDTGKANAAVTQVAALPGYAIIVVTAEDGVSHKAYYIYFTVAPTVKDTDATLSGISVNGAALAGFNPSTVSYSVILPAGTTAVPVVTAAVHDTGKATAAVTQTTSVTGQAIIVVTAEDGNTHKIYTVNFSVAPVIKSTDATLSALAVNGAALTGFNPNTLTYNVILPKGTTAIPVVTATTHDTKAALVVTQAPALSGSATVAVTAEDGTTKNTYTVNFTVSAS